MKKIIVALIALCLAGVSASAVPARPGKFTYTQPDGTLIVLRRVGDEFYHRTLDENGREMYEDEDGWYRPVTQSTPMAHRQARAKRAQVNRSRVKASTNIDLNKGERRIPVLLASFRDQDFTIDDPNAKFTALLNQKGYSYNGAVGSVRDYYEDNSDGQFKPVFDVYGPIPLNSNMSTYGGNSGGYDKAPELAIIEAAQALDDEIDFSKYDYDGDGYVDMVLFYYAGYNEAEGGASSTIWPHSWNITQSDNSYVIAANDFDGKKLDNYFCTSELKGGSGDTMCGIGTTCHEFGHSLGLPDFYDTDYGDRGDSYGENHGYAADPYSYSVMCAGSYNHDGKCPPYMNVEEKILLGWLDTDAIQVITQTGQYTVPAVQNNIAYITTTSRDGEYFLYECRSSRGWDKYLPGGPGLIVYHVDKSSTLVAVYDERGYAANISAHDLWYNWEATNQINENAKHPCYYIVPALDQDRIAQPCDYSGEYVEPEYDETRIPFPNGSVNSYTPIDWAGVSGSAEITNIAYNSTAAQVTMKVSIPTGELDWCVIDNPGGGNYAAGTVFDLNIVAPESVTPTAVSWFFDDEPVSGSSVVLTAGPHCIEAVITLDGGLKQTLTLEITAQ